MPEQLSKMDCEACDANSPRITAEEERELLPQLPGWRKVEEDSEPRLRRMFAFPDFAQALAFTNRVGTLAEEQNHHPDILLKWGKVQLTLRSHDVNAITGRDFRLAAAIDAVS